MNKKVLIRDNLGNLIIKEEDIMGKLYNHGERKFNFIYEDKLINDFPLEDIQHNLSYMLNQLINKSYLYKLLPEDNINKVNSLCLYMTADLFLKYSIGFIHCNKPVLIRMNDSDLEVYENKNDKNKIVELTITSDKILNVMLFGNNHFYVSISKNKQNKYEYLLKYNLKPNEKIIISPDLNLIDKCISKDKRKFYYRTYLLKLKLNVLN